MSSNSKERRQNKRSAEREAAHQRRISTAPIYPASMWWGVGAAFIPTILSSALLFVPFNSTGGGDKIDIALSSVIGGAIISVFYLIALFCAHTGFSQRPLRDTFAWIFKSRDAVNGLLSVLSIYVLLMAVMIVSGFGIGSQGFLAASGLAFAFSVYSAMRVSYRGFYYDYFSDDPERDHELEQKRFDYRESSTDDRENIPNGPINRLVTATREAAHGDGFRGRMSGVTKALFVSRRVPGRPTGLFFKTLLFAVVVPGVAYSSVVALAIQSPLLLILPTTTVPLLCLVFWASWVVSETGLRWKTRLHNEHTSLYRYYADTEIMDGINLYNTEHPSWSDRRVLKESGLKPKSSSEADTPEVS